MPTARVNRHRTVRGRPAHDGAWGLHRRLEHRHSLLVVDTGDSGIRTLNIPTAVAIAGVSVIVRTLATSRHQAHGALADCQSVRTTLSA